MVSSERLIRWGRNEKSGNGRYIVGAAVAAVWVVIPSNLARVAILLITSIPVAIILFSNFLADQISITCVQVVPDPREDQISTEDIPDPGEIARAQHYKEYKMEAGYTALEVYVDIPEWREEFEIDISSAESVGLAAWKYPDDVREDKANLWCKNKKRELTFILSVSGENEDLGTGKHSVSFVDGKSESEIDTIYVESRRGGLNR